MARVATKPPAERRPPPRPCLARVPGWADLWRGLCALAQCQVPERVRLAARPWVRRTPEPAPLPARILAALSWVEANSVKGAGIKVHAGDAPPYPEVSGYFIPTLLDWGERDRALAYARWLASIQNEDGSWSDAEGKAAYTFDTGQILKGL